MVFSYLFGKSASYRTTIIFKKMGDFIKGAQDGIIVFSLGSFLSVNSVPKPIQEAMSAAFKRLPNYR